MKARHVVDVYDEYSDNPNNEAQVYLKSEADKVIRHHKYKRCLWLARWCASRSASWCLDPADDELHKSEFYEKWKLRWLELAEKFKPNSTTQQGKGKQNESDKETCYH